jgi:hypothetical protein
VNGHVTANAFPAGLKSQPAVRNLRLTVKPGMTLQAKLTALTPNQKHAIGTSVRIVAGHAAFDFYRRMFEHKRPALLHMALDAGFRSGISEARCIPRAVRVMAVRTLHQAFWNTVMLRLRELCLDRLMAGEAERRLGQFEQTVVPPTVFFCELGQVEKIALGIAQVTLTQVLHFVDEVRGVALAAGNSVPGMLGMLE